MTNLRQQIETIQSDKSCPKDWMNNCNGKHCPTCRTDRICEAIKAKVEEMPQHECHQTKGRCYICQARDEFLIDCKSYLMEELK